MSDIAMPPPPITDPAFVAEPTVVATDVSVWFAQKVALSDVSCSFGAGVTGLLGPNGAGKTTLMRAIVGMTDIDQGTVRVLGHDPRGDRRTHRRVALVPEDEAVPGGVSLEGFVRYIATLHRVTDRGAVDRAIATVGLDDVRQRTIAGFSKGMRQRAKVAAALVIDPQVLVLDEPLNGADPVQRVNLIALFTALGEHGHTVIVSSHVLAEVERMAPRVIVIVGGRLAAAGSHRAIRDAMDDHPRRVLVRSSDDRRLAASLLAVAAVGGVDLDDHSIVGDGVVVGTRQARALAVALPRVARDAGVRLLEIRQLDDSLEAMFRELIG